VCSSSVVRDVCCISISPLQSIYTYVYLYHVYIYIYLYVYNRTVL